MSAPTVTARGTPAGTKLDDGFSTKVAFAADPTIAFFEKTVQPPGFDGGDATASFAATARFRKFRHYYLCGCRAAFRFWFEVALDRNCCVSDLAGFLFFSDASGLPQSSGFVFHGPLGGS